MTRINAVEEYLSGKTLKYVAQKYKIHINTLSRWVNIYRKTGKMGLSSSSFFKPWNQSPPELEDRVIMLKENEPGLTIRKARSILLGQGLSLSLKGIYNIWKRYNLLRRPVMDPYSPFGPLNRASCLSADHAQYLMDSYPGPRGIAQAAVIVNAMPAFPREKEKILSAIPDRYLTPRRKLDKVCLEFMILPMPEFRAKVKKVRNQLEKDRFFYSSTIAGLIELLALHWMNTPQEEYRVWSILQKRVKHIKDPVMNFQLSFIAASVFAKTGDIAKARHYIMKNRNLLRSLPYKAFYESHGDLMAFSSNYKKARYFYLYALNKSPGKNDRVHLQIKLMMIYVLAGEYKEALRISKLIKIDTHHAAHVNYTVYKGLLYYGLGKFDKAISSVTESYACAEKEQFRNMLYAAVLTRATLARALSRIDEAEEIIMKHLQLVRKYGLLLEQAVLEFLLRGKLPAKSMIGLPIVKLFYKLKKARTTQRVKDYRDAVVYAEKKGLLGFFHRYVVFQPDIVLNIQNKGKKTGLPRTILRFPVLNERIHVYNIRFLGPIRISRYKINIKPRLTPKEKSLLVYLAIKLNEPGRSIPLKGIYKNFWPKSKNPASQLSHILVRLKTKLLIPAHLIYISSKTGDRRLTNKGFYISTDFQDFRTLVAEARALERADEWIHARPMFKQAFKLIRGEPFRHIYDDWSENMRILIINNIRSALNDYIRNRTKHGTDERLVYPNRFLKRISNDR
jgi:transposase/tetratricopeptide (TPR) repeat protein